MTYDSASIVREACRAPTDGEDVEPLPAEVTELLVALAAPPRLAAHLRAVHSAAVAIADGLAASFPRTRFDAAAVLFGAATHDIGKVAHPHELTGPGAQHEPDGEQLLLDRGIDADRARFARTHARWDATVPLEDLLVSLADKVWKGRREAELEQLVVDRLCADTGQDAWDVFLRLDDLLADIAASADARLAFQNRYPVA